MVNAKMDLQSSLLAEKLNLRLQTATYPVPVTKAYDTNGDVYLAITVSSTIDAIIRFTTVAAPASGATDGLGLTQRVYTPHLAQVLFDIAATTGTTELVKFQILGEIMRVGTQVDLYEIDASGKAGGSQFLQLVDIAVGNFVSSFLSLEWGGSASV